MQVPCFETAAQWRVVVHRATSAKREATRERRLAQLVECSAESRDVPRFSRS